MSSIIVSLLWSGHWVYAWLEFITLKCTVIVIFSIHFYFFTLIYVWQNLVSRQLKFFTFFQIFYCLCSENLICTIASSGKYIVIFFVTFEKKVDIFFLSSTESPLLILLVILLFIALYICLIFIHWIVF